MVRSYLVCTLWHDRKAIQRLLIACQLPWPVILPLLRALSIPYLLGHRVSYHRAAEEKLGLCGEGPSPRTLEHEFAPLDKVLYPSIFFLSLPIYRPYSIPFLRPYKLLQMPALIAFTSGCGPAVAIWKRLTPAACTVFISLWLFQAPSPQVPFCGWLKTCSLFLGFLTLEDSMGFLIKFCEGKGGAFSPPPPPPRKLFFYNSS